MFRGPVVLIGPLVDVLWVIVPWVVVPAVVVLKTIVIDIIPKTIHQVIRSEPCFHFKLWVKPMYTVADAPANEFHQYIYCNFESFLVNTKSDVNAKKKFLGLLFYKLFSK